MKLISNIDKSINFVEEQLTGFLESRYVRKVPEYFICYLSSQDNCSHNCRFCHLTATGQNKNVRDTTLAQYIDQVDKVFRHYLDEKEGANYVHFNFMARGEALANKDIIENADEILYELGKRANHFDSNLSVKFNVSTILPNTMDRELSEIFRIIHPTIYYSFYSADPTFRKKWLPKALPLEESLHLLKGYQDFSKKKIKIHHCFIEDENDDQEDVEEMLYLLSEHKHNLNVEFNLVRYNPYSSIQGKESSDEVIKRNIQIIENQLGKHNVKIIPRVGYDVQGSCGMFYKTK